MSCHRRARRLHRRLVASFRRHIEATELTRRSTRPKTESEDALSTTPRDRFPIYRFRVYEVPVLLQRIS